MYTCIYMYAVEQLAAMYIYTYTCNYYEHINTHTRNHVIHTYMYTCTAHPNTLYTHMHMDCALWPNLRVGYRVNGSSVSWLRGCLLNVCGCGCGCGGGRVGGGDRRSGGRWGRGSSCGCRVELTTLSGGSALYKNRTSM